MAPPPDRPDLQIEDSELMRRVQASDESAFAALMQRWELPVKAVIARLVLNTHEAEELAQETFVRMWEHRSRFTAGRAVKPWIFGIAVNLARNRRRWWRRRPSVSLEEWTETPDQHDGIPLEGKAALERAERAAAVRDAIAQLPHDYREALVLYEYEEMSYTEIAGVLGVNTKTVENRILRARSRLRALLEPWVSSPTS